eukprot:15464244-Alexandrium_andersonii.AAC.1
MRSTPRHGGPTREQTRLGRPAVYPKRRGSPPATKAPLGRRPDVAGGGRSATSSAGVATSRTSRAPNPH